MESDTRMTDHSSESNSQITSADLQERFSRLTGESDETPASIQRPGVVAGAVLVSGMLVLVCSFKVTWVMLTLDLLMREVKQDTSMVVTYKLLMTSVKVQT